MDTQSTTCSYNIHTEALVHLKLAVQHLFCEDVRKTCSLHFIIQNISQVQMYRFMNDVVIGLQYTAESSYSADNSITLKTINATILSTCCAKKNMGIFGIRVKNSSRTT